MIWGGGGRGGGVDRLVAAAEGGALGEAALGDGEDGHGGDPHVHRDEGPVPVQLPRLPPCQGRLMPQPQFGESESAPYRNRCGDGSGLPGAGPGPSQPCNSSLLGAGWGGGRDGACLGPGPTRRGGGPRRRGRRPGSGRRPSRPAWRLREGGGRRGITGLDDDGVPRPLGGAGGERGAVHCQKFPIITYNCL